MSLRWASASIRFLDKYDRGGPSDELMRASLQVTDSTGYTETAEETFHATHFVSIYEQVIDRLAAGVKERMRRREAIK